jgi:ribosome maturation factor RimP
MGEEFRTHMSGTELQVKSMIEPAAEAMGFELVRVRYTTGKRPTLQIMAEREDGTMSVDDCAELSRTVSALLDVEDPIRGEYDLEVSSPGIDRPLVREKDFERWAGFDAKVELRIGLDGQRRFRGTLIGMTGGNVILETDKGRAALPFEDIDQAKLVLTDALIAAHQTAADGPSRGAEDNVHRD